MLTEEEKGIILAYRKGNEERRKCLRIVAFERPEDPIKKDHPEEKKPVEVTVEEVEEQGRINQKRDQIEKAISAYTNFADRTGRGIFYASDGMAIADRNRRPNGYIDPYGAIQNSLEAGFWKGYQCRKREEAQKRKNDATRAKI